MTQSSVNKSKIPIPYSSATSPSQIMQRSRQASPEDPDNAAAHTITSQPSKKRVIKEVTGSKAEVHVQLEDLATSLMPLMIKNLRESVTMNIEKTLNNLSEALDLKLSQIDLKLDTINSKNDNIDRNIHLLTKTVDELKPEHQLFENKVNDIESETVNLRHEIGSLRNSTMNLEEQKKIISSEVQMMKTKLDQPITDLLTNEFRGHVEQQLRQTRTEIQQSFDDILKNKLQLGSQMMDTSSDMTSIAADCRMEMMEQYARRDCLMFFGLEEEEGEDTTQKVVETVNAMGANLSAEEVFYKSPFIYTK